VIGAHRRQRHAKEINLSDPQRKSPHSDDLLLDSYWYHSIELLPGVYTPGQNHANLLGTRELLKGCQVAGSRCLDIGTMDGLMAALLCRRGAEAVVACDRLARPRETAIVKRCLGVDFTYLSNVLLPDLRQIAPKLGPPFDLIVFSGVLYHMYDPMVGLALVRSMIRTGGLLVLETDAAHSKAMMAYFNSSASLARDLHHYWDLSVTLLDYLLRYFCFKPLDCCYVRQEGRNRTSDGSELLRCAVVCRAVEAREPDMGDEWMVGERYEDAEYPPWGDHGNSAPLAYQSTARPLVQRPSGSVNLYDTIASIASLVWTPDRSRLDLGAMD
jgi:2-polyprenyl-3-methyl-5-hydroxy-6-metoxy-1,4-benzoquinol methylase